MTEQLEEARATMASLATLEHDLPQMISDAAKASRPRLVSELRQRQATIGDELFEARQEFFTLEDEQLLQKLIATAPVEKQAQQALIEAKEKLAVVQKAVDVAQIAYQSVWLASMQLSQERQQVAENLRRLKNDYELSTDPSIRVDGMGNPMPKMTPGATIGAQEPFASRQLGRNVAGMDVNAGRTPHPRDA